MALKVVPAGDERCDIHNRRSPPSFICEDCLKQSGVEPARHVTSRRRRIRRLRPRHVLRQLRSGQGRRVLIGAGVVVALAIVALIAAGLFGGGGDDPTESALPSEADVVSALDLQPNPSGSGWITSDGACAVISIDRHELAQPAAQGEALAIEASNEDGTVVALVIPTSSSISQEGCVAQVDAALKAAF